MAIAKCGLDFWSKGKAVLTLDWDVKRRGCTVTSSVPGRQRKLRVRRVNRLVIRCAAARRDVRARETERENGRHDDECQRLPRRPEANPI